MYIEAPIRKADQIQQVQHQGAAGAEESKLWGRRYGSTLYEYDFFGNLTGQTLALAEQPDSTNSPVAEFAYTPEQTEEGGFCCAARMRYNAEGEALTKVEKPLISQLSVRLKKR